MITGKKVRLRPLEREDLSRSIVWLNDAEVIQHLSISTPMSRDMEEKWFDNLEKGAAEERPLAIEALTPEGWIHIGNTGFHKINGRDRETEIGIVIGEKDFWGKGYGSEAMKLMLDYGFNTVNLNRIFLHVYETNPRGIRAYEKVGFVLEGRMRQSRFLNGRYVDVLLMSVLRSEWKGYKA